MKSNVRFKPFKNTMTMKSAQTPDKVALRDIRESFDREDTSVLKAEADVVEILKTPSELSEDEYQLLYPPNPHPSSDHPMGRLFDHCATGGVFK